MKTLKYIVLGVLMISLSLSGITNLLGQKGSIEFLETYSYNEITSNLDPGDRFFQLFDSYGADPESSKLGDCSSEKVSELWAYIHGEAFIHKLPDDIRFAWGVQKEENQLTLYALKEPYKAATGPDQSDILDVAIKKNDQEGTYSLLISFSEEGAEEWATLTGKNVGRNIAMVIDGDVYAAPVVREKIEQGKCVISGNFSKNEVSRLKEKLE